jgi:ankyrin repeat protein
VENGHFDVTLLLLERGANLQIRDGGNLNLFQMAMQNGNKQIAQLLLEHGADTE